MPFLRFILILFSMFVSLPLYRIRFCLFFVLFFLSYLSKFVSLPLYRIRFCLFFLFSILSIILLLIPCLSLLPAILSSLPPGFHYFSSYPIPLSNPLFLSFALSFSVSFHPFITFLPSFRLSLPPFHPILSTLSLSHSPLSTLSLLSFLYPTFSFIL